MSKLTDKLALVTGGSRGIGRASALALAKEGAKVIVHYNSAQDEAEAVVRAIESDGGTAYAVSADLGAPDGPHQLAELVKEIAGERLDVLVANAGIPGTAPVDKVTVELFDRLYAVNLRAPFFLVQELLPVLGDGSSVTFVTSIAARTAVGNLSAYAATKGAVSTLVKYLAVALGEKGVRVNGVAPGVIATEMSSFTKTEEGRGFALSIQALKRLGQPDDVGSVVAFLSSDEARWITGDILDVSGGSKL